MQPIITQPLNLWMENFFQKDLISRATNIARECQDKITKRVKQVVVIIVEIMWRKITKFPSTDLRTMQPLIQHHKNTRRRVRKTGRIDDVG